MLFIYIFLFITMHTGLLSLLWIFLKKIVLVFPGSFPVNGTQIQSCLTFWDQPGLERYYLL